MCFTVHLCSTVYSGQYTVYICFTVSSVQFRYVLQCHHVSLDSKIVCFTVSSSQFGHVYTVDMFYSVSIFASMLCH